jgi:hypothetical protein
MGSSMKARTRITKPDHKTLEMRSRPVLVMPVAG